jgi:hypothetical protein
MLLEERKIRMPSRSAIDILAKVTHSKSDPTPVFDRKTRSMPPYHRLRFQTLALMAMIETDSAGWSTWFVS